MLRLDAAKREGFTVEVDNSCDDWDYARAADYLLNRLQELRQKSERSMSDFRRRGHSQSLQRWRWRP